MVISSPIKTTGAWMLAILFCLSLLGPGSPVFAGWAAQAAGPVIDTNLDLNLPAGSAAVIGYDLLHAYSPGKGSLTPVVYTLVETTRAGTLRLDGASLAQGATFTQADIDINLLSYAASAAVGSDGFDFTLSDGEQTSGVMSYRIHINDPEPAAYPTGFSAAADSTSAVTVTWTDAPGADGYLLLCSPWGAPNPPTDTAYPINNSCGDGSGSQHIAQGVQSVTWEGLYSETTYDFAIFPYTETPYAGMAGSFFDYLTSGEVPVAQARTLLTYSITGQIFYDDTLMMGVLVDAGDGHTAYSGEDGTYTLTGLEPGVYTLTTGAPCFRFEPPTLDVTVGDANNHVYAPQFTAVAMPCVRGSVLSPDGLPLAGVEVTDGMGRSVITLEDGGFAFTAPGDPWSGRLAARKTNHYFTPFARTYTGLAAGVMYGEDFNASLLDVSAHYFTAVWESAAWATGYTLDVASDPDFTSFVPGFENKEAGNVTGFEVTGLAAHTRYYYRVRPHDDTTTGVTSFTTEVLTDWAHYFPLVTR